MTRKKIVSSHKVSETTSEDNIVAIARLTETESN